MEVRTRTKKKKKGRRKLHQNFASYLNFGVSSTICACCFLTVYLLLLGGLLPLLNYDDPAINNISNNPDGRINIRHHLKGNNNGDGGESSSSSSELSLHNLPVMNEQEKQVIGHMAQNLKTKLLQKGTDPLFSTAFCAYST